MKQKFQGITLECLKGNIADQPDMEAIVNAANADLRIGGGVAGAIHRAAGPELEKACHPLAPIQPGNAVITNAYKLPNRHVIHCLGPVYGADEPSDELLASCYRNALNLAEDNDITSIAFPALSTGAFGYPMEPAAKMAFETIIDMLPSMSSIKHIRFVLFHDADVLVHERAAEGLIRTRNTD